LAGARVAGERGVVATSHPLAAAAGIEALETGGTAADAAVAASAVLCVVDPRSTGVGGDLFALYWAAGEGAPIGLAAAGPAPSGMTVDAVRAEGYGTMPSSGPWTITVPGAVAGWGTLLSRCGKLELGDALAAAVRHAHAGFAVTPRVAEEWGETAAKLREDAAAAEVFLREGDAPRVGETFSNPALGRVLETIATDGPRSFYEGELAERIGEAVAAAGGPLRGDDLGAWRGPTWEEPIHAAFGDLDVFEMPPPGQGIVVLEALGIYSGLPRPTAADREHASVESVKLAFADARAYVADPDRYDVPVDEFLAEPFLERRRSEVRLDQAIDAVAARLTDTVYVAATDGDGNACSLIQSLYDGFGSGVAVPGTGIILQNRGAGFVLDDTHPNRPEPGKRPYHTIIPAMLGRAGVFAAALGVVGGFQQPQGQVQIIRHLVEDGMSPQEAVDAPRFRSLGGRRIGLEVSFDPTLAQALAERGHEISNLRRFEAGGAQLIVREGRVDIGASDPRKDGLAVAR
jgi:gamma-glutamyltranspeptidase/glutathione hydrolase